MIHDYLPMNRAEMNIRGWNQCDFVYVSGDAYVDHPSFGHAIITRLLEAHGYRAVSYTPLDVYKRQVLFSNSSSSRVSGRYSPGFSVSSSVSVPMDSLFKYTT